MSCQHHRLSITLQILLTKTFNWLFLANSTDKYAHQWTSSPPAWSSTGSHICQFDLLGIADYIVFVDRICNVCANLPTCLDSRTNTQKSQTNIQLATMIFLGDGGQGVTTFLSLILKWAGHVCSRLFNEIMSQSVTLQQGGHMTMAQLTSGPW